MVRTIGVQFPAGAMKRFFSSVPCQNLLWGPSSLLPNGYWELFPGAKWLGHEAEVKNVWSYTFNHPWCLINKGTFSLYDT